MNIPHEPPPLSGVWKTLHPAVPRHWLFVFSGLIWIGVGLLLCGRTIGWLAPFGFTTGIALEAAGVLIAAVGYYYGFSAIVERNIARIHTLPERVCAFAFTAWRGYIMIGCMVTIGVTLRNSSIPKEYLAVPYTAMGGMLLFGSQRFIRQFIAAALERR